jgi:hypothetical protein
MILTVNTAQAAIGEKYRTCPLGAHQAGFFPLVQGNQCDTHLFPRTAKAHALYAINSATAWAEITIRNIQHFALSSFFIQYLLV